MLFITKREYLSISNKFYVTCGGCSERYAGKDGFVEGS